MDNKALVITNKGLIDALAFELIGASTKRNDNETIGFFGSGLKYAIAGLLRRGIPFQVWRGEELLDITTEEVELRGEKFERIFFDGKATSLTTAMGPKWEPWMLIRELYANAIDEDGEMALTTEFRDFITADRTTFVFPEPSFIDDVLSRQDMLFCRNREIVFENNEIRIYEEIGNAGFYVKGILVRECELTPGYGYMLKKKPYDINEERQVRDYFQAIGSTAAAIFRIDDPKMVKKLVSRARVKDSFERTLMCSGWVDGGVMTAPAWDEIVFFKQTSEEFATEWNHLVVADNIYRNIEHKRKWEQRRWTGVGSEIQNKRLRDLVRRMHEALPNVIPTGTWQFGKTDSRSLAMGVEGCDVFVSLSQSELSDELLAASIFWAMAPDATKLTVLGQHFKEKLATIQ